MPLKKIILTTTAVTSLGFAGSAYAGEGVYYQFHGGANFITNDDLDGTVLGTPFSTDYDADTGYAIGAALGKRLNDSWRAEAELTYRDNEIGDVGGVPVDGDVTSTALMFNGYYDFYTESDLEPYVGAGIGYADVEVGGEGEDVFAYQFKAGVAKPVGTTGGKIGAELNYFATEDIEFSDGTDTIDATYGNTSLLVFWRNEF